MQKRVEVNLSEFRIFETDQFIKRLEKMSSTDVGRVRSKLKSYVYPQLREDPFWGPNIKKLRDYSPSTWRYRINKFRLFYTIDTTEKIVFILTIDFRKSAYK